MMRTRMEYDDEATCEQGWDMMLRQHVNKDGI